MPNSISTGQQRQAKRLLLVEPPSSDRERHLKTLQRYKYKVTVADSVDVARGHWAPAQFGLVMMAVNGSGDAVARFCGEIKNQDARQVIALIFHPDQDLPATDCPTIIFTTEPDEYFLARVETLTAAAQAA
jgi:DNA-binding NtrC family response regulator